MPIVASRTQWIAFAIAALALAVAIALFVDHGDRVRQASRVVSHTQAVLRELDQLIDNLREAQSRQHAFVITGDEPQAVGFTAAAGSAAEGRAALARLFADEAAQRDRLGVLDKVITGWLAGLDGVIGRRRSDGFDAARAALDTDATTAGMRDIRAVVGRMIADQEARLTAGRLAMEATFQRTAVHVALAAGVGLMMLVLLFASLKRQETNQARLNEALRNTQADLASQVQQRSAELAEANEQLQRASEAKSAFLAHMSHELRTPLNAILGFSDMMLHQILGPLGDRRYYEYAGHIRRSGEHLLELVNDVLDLSKIEAGRLELDEVPIDVDALIEASVNMLRGRASERGIRIVCTSEDSGAIVRGDERRLRQVLLNLLSNAVKYSRADGVIRLQTREAHGDALAIEVCDDGIGMTPSELAIAMEPFAQIRNAANRDEQGTGLGLPLSCRLMELHGGSLELTSDPGEGTRAIARLPAARRIRAAA